MNRDLTVGKPERVLWQYCMPLFGSVIFQQLYNLADSFVAGKFIGRKRSPPSATAMRLRSSSSPLPSAVTSAARLLLRSCSARRNTAI